MGRLVVVVLCVCVAGLAFGSVATLAAAPVVSEEFVGSVAATTASVNALVDSEGVETSAFFEYGTSVAYGSSTAPQELGEGTEATLAESGLSGLAASTEYHYRAVATNAKGETTDGPDETFSTSAVEGGSPTLPDGRAYELVSPAEKEGGRGGVFTLDFDDTSSVFGQSTESSPDGDAIAYVGEPFYRSHNGGTTNVYVSERTSSGWSTRDITPADPNSDGYSQGERVVGLSSDLSSAIFEDGVLLGAGAPSDLPREYRDLWLQNGAGPYRPLVDSQAFEFSTKAKEPREFSQPVFDGSSNDLSHVIFEAHDTLTSNAAPVGGTYQENSGGNLYEWSEGRLSLVNELPGPTGGTEPAGFGSGIVSGIGVEGQIHNSGFVPNLSHVISSDGSRVFWSTVENGQPKVLYVREDAGTPQARTVQIAVGGQFWTASTDGSLAFYTKGGELFQFDTNTEATTDLTPGGTVEGVIGASEDGSYVYVVGALTAGGVADQPNLYALHDGETRYIATLSPEDNQLRPAIFTEGDRGDWVSTFADRTARVSPNGLYVAFLSKQNITRYNSHGVFELYRYGVEEGRVVCASCQPSGAPPDQVLGGAIANRNYSSFETPAINGIYQQRYLSNTGQVFFDSNEALVAQDTNGTTDVYEYENGKPFLISPGTGGPSNFADASENGDNVFFTTRSQLVSQDQDQNVDMYDARVDGGFPPPVGAECTGTGCQGVPPAPPIFATPSSVTFDGVGNFPPPSKPAVKAKAKKSTLSQQLEKALKACHVMRNRQKRAACEAGARKRYGPKSKAGKSAIKSVGASDGGSKR